MTAKRTEDSSQITDKIVGKWTRDDYAIQVTYQNNLHFLPIEIKHLLPVHQDQFCDNLHTIVYHQAERETWNVHVDRSLTIKEAAYQVLSGGWCQDIDGAEGHLKASLELAAIVLNYLHSLVQNPGGDEEVSSEAVQRVDHIGGRDSSRDETFPVVIAYNVYKTKDKNNAKKMIFMVGQHKTSKMRMYALANSVRLWNLHRLRSEMCKQVLPHKIHKHVEYLLVILRGFMPMVDDDHQIKRKQLEDIIQRLDCQALPKVVPREGIEGNHEVVVSRFQWVYKGVMTQKQISGIVADALYELIKIMPVNSPCSYVGKSHFEPKLNMYILLWMTTYKRPENHIQPTQTHLCKLVENATGFMRRKSVEEIKDSSTNIADQMLRSSLKVLNRYTPDNGSKVKEWASQVASGSRMGSSSMKNSMRSSGIEEKERSRVDDRMSMISRISFKDTQSVRDVRVKLDAQFQSLSSPLMAHRDREYAELLATIDQWELLHGKVPTWTELHTLLRRNCDTAKVRYSRSDLSKAQSELLLSLVAIRKYLDSDEFLLLLKYHSEYRDCLFEILFQGSAGSFLHDLGLKIAKQYARPLYESYLTKQFKIDKDNLLTAFMKKMVSTFASGVLYPNICDKINLPLLIELLDNRQFLGQKYKILTKGVMEDIFKPNKSLLILCPMLLEVYLALADDHHEELVNGLLGDLAFESIYFSSDNGGINNSPYRQDKSIKQKKVFQLLRQGGFNTLGYELRSVLKPHIIQHSSYKLPPSRIYEEIVMNRPLQLSKFVELISNSTFVQHLPEITTWFGSMQQVANTVTRPLANAYLHHEVDAFNWMPEEEERREVLKSESGIFRQLLEYNPQLKLAGRHLSEVVRQQMPDKVIPTERFDAGHILKSIFKQNLQEIYEYIAITSNLKQKYEGYEGLLEDEKIYLREIVHQILCHKTDILDYLYISLLARQATQGETAFLF